MLNARYYPRLDTPLVAFQNHGQYHFTDTTEEWGLNTPGVHHGIAVADFDGDGALDVVVNNLGAAAGFYRNTTSAPRVAVRLKGLNPNVQGIGAKSDCWAVRCPCKARRCSAAAGTCPAPTDGGLRSGKVHRRHEP